MLTRGKENFKISYMHVDNRKNLEKRNKLKINMSSGIPYYRNDIKKMSESVTLGSQLQKEI